MFCMNIVLNSINQKIMKLRLDVGKTISKGKYHLPFSYCKQLEIDKLGTSTDVHVLWEKFVGTLA